MSGYRTVKVYEETYHILKMIAAAQGVTLVTCLDDWARLQGRALGFGDDIVGSETDSLEEITGAVGEGADSGVRAHYGFGFPVRQPITEEED